MSPPDNAEIIAALKESECRLRAILDSTADAIVIIDFSGTIIEVNPATLRLFGYREDELLGRDVSIFMPSPHRENHHHYIELYRATGEARVIGIGREVRGRRKDGSTFPLELAVNPIDHLGMFCGIMRDISDRHSLERQVIHAVMDERRRSARKLHYGLGSLLTAVHLRLDALAKSLVQADAESGKEAFEICDLIKRALSQARAIAKGLEPVGQEPDDLMLSLAEFADQVRQASSLRCEFRCPEPVLIHAPFLARHLYRIAQGPTSNAVKHSERQPHCDFPGSSRESSRTLGCRRWQRAGRSLPHGCRERPADHALPGERHDLRSPRRKRLSGALHRSHDGAGG